MQARPTQRTRRPCVGAPQKGWARAPPEGRSRRNTARFLSSGCRLSLLARAEDPAGAGWARSVRWPGNEQT